MYEFLRGRFCGMRGSAAVVDVGGVGFQVSVPVGTALPAVGGEVMLTTSYVVRETSVALYGFASPGERDLFEVLMGVSGVGPKMALALMSLGDLQQALARGDAKAIARAPGVGKRTAERLVLELKGKLPAATAGSSMLEDAVSALLGLGFSQTAAREALERAGDAEDLPTLISSALSKWDKR